MWVQLIVWVACMLLSSLLSKQAGPQNAKPGSISDKDLPIVTTSTPVPVVFGTCWCEQPNVVDWWGLRTVAIRESSGGKK